MTATLASPDQYNLFTPRRSRASAVARSGCSLQPAERCSGVSPNPNGSTRWLPGRVEDTAVGTGGGTPLPQGHLRVLPGPARTTPTRGPHTRTAAQAARRMPLAPPPPAAAHALAAAPGRSGAFGTMQMVHWSSFPRRPGGGGGASPRSMHVGGASVPTAGAAAPSQRRPLTLPWTGSAPCPARRFTHQPCPTKLPAAS